MRMKANNYKGLFHVFVSGPLLSRKEVMALYFIKHLFVFNGINEGCVL